MRCIIMPREFLVFAASLLLVVKTMSATLHAHREAGLTLAERAVRRGPASGP